MLLKNTHKSNKSKKINSYKKKKSFIGGSLKKNRRILQEDGDDFSKKMKLSTDSIYEYISKANLIIESCKDSLSDTYKLDDNKKKILKRLIHESRDFIKSLHHIKEKLNKLNKIHNKPTFMNVFKNKVDIQEDLDTIQKELITINKKLTNNSLLLNKINNNENGFNRVKNIVMNNKIAATTIGLSAAALYGIHTHNTKVLNDSIMDLNEQRKNDIAREATANASNFTNLSKVKESHDKETVELNNLIVEESEKANKYFLAYSHSTDENEKTQKKLDELKSDFEELKKSITKNIKLEDEIEVSGNSTSLPTESSVHYIP
jgi:hypothetical protein